MQETKLKLEHASNSGALIRSIRRELGSALKNRTEWLPRADSLITQIQEVIEHTPDEYVPVEWHIISAGIRVLASQLTCLSIAQGGEGDLARENIKCNVLTGELRRLLSSDSAILPDTANSIRQSLIQSPEHESDKLCTFLLLIPLPTLYWHKKQSNFPYRDTTENHKTPPRALLRVIVFLDHDPISSPQLLKSDILYPLSFRIHGIIWPEDAVQLRIDLLTTCPESEFSSSEFILERPDRIENDEYQGDLAGQIIFKTGQSSLLDDLIFIVRGAFETSDKGLTEIQVIGHNELRIRVVNEDRHPLMTGNRRLDQHIEELINKLLSDCPSVQHELNDLLGILQALSCLLTTYAQEAIYKGRSEVSEAEFQAKVLQDLRFILRQDVQEHPKQAGGITDIKYRGVIVELKVEKANGDREQIARRYAAQSAQYAGVEARQVSVLLVLDLTSKDKPPGDIRNDIILTDVETHGGDSRSTGFPSKAFVFVINGNMKSPSDYSR